MNRADRMLEVLRDGRPHTRRDLFDRCGFFLTNNAAAELRARGYNVVQSRERVDGVVIYSYRLASCDEPSQLFLPVRSCDEPSQSASPLVAQVALLDGEDPPLGGRDGSSEEVGSLSEGESDKRGAQTPKHTALASGLSGMARSHLHSPSESEPTQPELFTYQRSPDWS